MIVYIKISSSLKKYIPATDRRLDGDRYNLPDKTSVSEIPDLLNLPENLAHIILINSRHTDPGNILNPGDTIEILPALSGG